MYKFFVVSGKLEQDPYYCLLLQYVKQKYHAKHILFDNFPKHCKYFSEFCDFLIVIGNDENVYDLARTSFPIRKIILFNDDTFKNAMLDIYTREFIRTDKMLLIGPERFFSVPCISPLNDNVNWKTMFFEMPKKKIVIGHYSSFPVDSDIHVESKLMKLKVTKDIIDKYNIIYVPLSPIDSYGESEMDRKSVFDSCNHMYDLVPSFIDATFKKLKNNN